MDDHGVNGRLAGEVVRDHAARARVGMPAVHFGWKGQVVIEGDQRDVTKVFGEPGHHFGSIGEENGPMARQQPREAGPHFRHAFRAVFQDGDERRHSRQL